MGVGFLLHPGIEFRVRGNASLRAKQLPSHDAVRQTDGGETIIAGVILFFTLHCK